ncbi:diaminohydroxyphosphoribosylaminopyrimidine deaminase / 5-amino-6-(5-phosphoribosylamino)uracil reductase [Phycisphaerales bacterium]|nr:diaminohydroxyphosphoribosylaminopyrimidine deaminase / 5-amino-6-(5-phosphoribosylamino)uracil reductase [Phycisphaerales bacterium]
MITEHDTRFLDLAARHALRAFGRVEPNPLVGAAIVRDGRLIGLGHHRRFGGAHAERDALEDAARRGEDVRGATMYTTLEPCASPGKQPPCTEAILKSGIARVVFARQDPHPSKGGGAAWLREGGVPCDQSNASALATGISAPFVKRTVTGLPWVIAKWAQTIDGRVATRTGESKWISGDVARRRVHRLRSRVDAVLTGIGTVIADDPMLTPRGVPIIRTAARVVADTDLDIPPDAAMVKTAHEVPTLVACDGELAGSAIMARRRADLERSGVKVVPVLPADNGRGIDLRELLKTLLEEHDIATVLVEAGPGLLGTLFEQDLVDEAVVYIAPMLLGDELAKSAAVGRIAESLTSAKRLNLWRVKSVGGDVELVYRAPRV